MPRPHLKELCRVLKWRTESDSFEENEMALASEIATILGTCIAEVSEPGTAAAREHPREETECFLTQAKLLGHLI